MMRLKTLRRNGRQPIKKAPLIRQVSLILKSDFKNFYSCLSLRQPADGVGTFLQTELCVRVAKASKGHYPLPFLIRCFKNYCKCNSGSLNKPNKQQRANF
jgi:hypothetical protein